MSYDFAGSRADPYGGADNTTNADEFIENGATVTGHYVHHHHTDGYKAYEDDESYEAYEVHKSYEFIFENGTTGSQGAVRTRTAASTTRPTRTS